MSMHRDVGGTRGFAARSRLKPPRDRVQMHLFELLEAWVPGMAFIKLPSDSEVTYLTA